MNKLQIGMYLGASTAAFGLVSTDHVWVEAQPKETQLTYAKNGDPVDVSFDIYPGRTWSGTVESVAPATDQNFSLLPAENSSGNWVKVVQRIPVRVRVDMKPGDPPLRAGMSADIDIDTGHVRRSVGPVLGFVDAEPTAAGGAASRHHNGVRDDGDADAVVGFDDRERRSAVYAGQPVREFRSDYLGADVLYHRGGDHDRSGGLAVGTVRLEATCI